MRTKPGAAGGTLREILADHPFSNGQSDLSTILAAAPKVRKWPVLAGWRSALPDPELPFDMLRNGHSLDVSLPLRLRHYADGMPAHTDCSGAAPRPRYFITR